MKSRAAMLAGLLLVTGPPPAGAEATGKGLPPVARTRSDINLFLELHNQLLFASRGSEDAMPEYRSEVIAYKQAREMSSEPAVWRTLSDLCVIGPDIKAIGAAAESLPASMAAPDREAAKRVIGALVSAWPRFEGRDLDSHRISLQNILIRVFRRQFSGFEERLMTTLIDKMGFKPLEAPITIYPVITAAEAGVWGKTSQGYYLVVPTGRLPQMIVIENVLHELTHLYDANQPPGWSDFLVRLREKAAGADPQTLDEFMHGLVSWNAGEMIKRFVAADHKTYADLSPERRAKVERFLPAYAASWAGYMDGRLTADQAIEGLAAAAKAAAPARPAAGSGSGS